MNEQEPALDAFTGEALVSGHGRDAADPLSGLLDALESPARPDELVGEQAAVAAIAAAMPSTPAVRARTDRRRLTTRAGALAAVGALCFSGVAAAAMGVPVPIVADVVGDGVDRPTLISTLVEGESETEVVVEDEEAEVPEESQAESEDEAGATESEDESADVDDKVDDADTPGPGNSDAARSDCGKTTKTEAEEDDGAEPAEAEPAEADPEADEPACDYDNHGEYVSDQAHQRNAERAEARELEKAERKAERSGDEAEAADDGEDEQKPDKPAKPEKGNKNKKKGD